ncbi:B3 domain-containing protein Os03g0619800 [Lolium perenne]|uniref:B3 domain-containing protein Os03g0619800 n=1 Tax=Lolium perenne TaxID=4522 RepID=UPI0021F5B5A4|nr:B3 domain-containing protein Os03g0619800-like [Lolium perenne]
MRNPPDERCKSRKFVRQMKSASKVKKQITSYAGSSSSSGDYPTEREGSDECRSGSSNRRGKQVQRERAPISSPSEQFSGHDSSEDESLEPEDYVPQRQKKMDYVFQRKYNLTKVQVEKIDAFVRKIQPTIPVLVVIMNKTNVNQYPDLAILKAYAIKYFPCKSQAITVKLPDKSKDWSCDFRIRPDGNGRNLYLGKFVRDNRVCVGDICIFQPVTNVDARRFMVTVHLFHEASGHHYPVGRNSIGTNHGITPKGFDDITKQHSGRNTYASCQKGSSRGRRNIGKIAAKSTSLEESGDDSPSEDDSFESEDHRAPQGPGYALSLGSCLSGVQYEKVTALIQTIQPETAVFVALMIQRDVQLPSPLLIISEEHAIAHFPHKSASVTLQRPYKTKKWHPRFYMKEDRSEYMLTGHWLDFVCDNSVQEGDICIFVAAKGGRRSKFTVHLLRGETTRSMAGVGGVQGAGSSQAKNNIQEEFSDGENVSSESNMHVVSHQSLESENSGSLLEPPYILPSKSSLSRSEKKIVQAKVQAIQSEVPIYVSIMKKSNIGAIRHHMMVLGSRYAARHLPHKNQTLVLECNGKSWETKMVTSRNRDGRRWFLSGGWSKFARGNRLRIGDICLFERKKNRRELTMKVHIIPARSSASS